MSTTLRDVNDLQAIFLDQDRELQLEFDPAGGLPSWAADDLQNGILVVMDLMADIVAPAPSHVPGLVVEPKVWMCGCCDTLILHGARIGRETPGNKVLLSPALVGTAAALSKRGDGSAALYEALRETLLRAIDNAGWHMDEEGDSWLREEDQQTLLDSGNDTLDCTLWAERWAQADLPVGCTDRSKAPLLH